ncbi:glycerophosphodiester phosphodiesterase family protein [Streptomyces thermolineatus]|uniref:Glycerophosphodiester phosphodiesterase family protein n=1 Tax=Streptomyces thermolineatus TaxID=44033 RepID=A0ABP5Y1R6_9ACTN
MSLLTIGHRGAAGVEPENTVRSFVRAQQEGLDVIELDLHLSKDGALVVMHDAAVDRTTDGTGLIGDLTLAELREFDAGLGERIPVFDEVVDAVTRPLQAEIKDVAAARVLADALRRRGLLDRVTVISFHDEALREVRTLLPGVRTALVASRRLGPDLVDRARAVGATQVCLKLRRLTLELAEMCRAAELEVFTWTVNTEQELGVARALGVNGITTDFPEIGRAAAAC